MIITNNIIIIIIIVLTFYITLEFKPDEAFNFTSEKVSQAFFDLFANKSKSTVSDLNDDLSAGAIVGISISVTVTLVIIVLVISAVIIYFCKHFEYKFK